MDGDPQFMRDLRAHLRANESLKILEFLKLKESCSDLVTYLKASGHIEELSKTPKQYMEVRWNSTESMFHSIYDVYDEVSKIILFLPHSL